MIVGISNDKGIDKIMIFEDYVNKWKFKIFAQAIRETYPMDKICLYFDNLAVHRSKDVREELDQL